MSGIKVRIQRQNGPKEKPYEQVFLYEGDVKVPVTTMLQNLNRQEKLKDIEGREARPVKWECSCEQGLCGSCAMVVNGKPGLGCQIFCHEALGKNGEISILPLSKFPVIQDLMIDRTEMFEAMKKMKLWLEHPARIEKKQVPFQYEVSQCLMCGCCLEVCPNYHPGDLFLGAPVVAAAVKLMEQEKGKAERKQLKKNYNRHVYKGCVKSLACQDICPMHIPTGTAISKMNRFSVWTLWNLFQK